MDKSLKSLIDPANSVLILLPTKPYFDQVAAGLGLFLALKDEKEVNISCPSEMLVELNRLIGINQVSKDLGNKNLVISFSDYQSTGIERVGYDIEDREFKLTVIPKPGVAPPKKEQVSLNYSGVSADVVILIGGANESHALGQKDLVGVKIVHIGTRALLSEGDRQVISLASPASSVSELTYTLIKESGFSISSDVATNLLLGVGTGSNNFSSDAVTADTFQAVADLMRAGGSRRREVRRSYPPGSIPGDLQARKMRVKHDEGVESEDRETEDTHKNWVGPKIYKGTTVS